MIAHSTYSYKLSKYDVHFGQLKVDTCPTCDAFRQSIAGFDNGAAKAKLEADWDAHKKVADSYYAAHKADEARTDREFSLVNWQYDPSAEFCCVGITETQCQDAAGNLRCPRLTVGEAYYKRILPVWIYGINSRGGKCTTICAWNETLGTKGANEVISCEHYHHMHNGTGAETLELWEDMCGGKILISTARCITVTSPTQTAPCTCMAGLTRRHTRRVTPTPCVTESLRTLNGWQRSGLLSLI